MLIDENTLRWFDIQINTIENLMEISQSDFLKLSIFKDFNKEQKTIMFSDEKVNKSIKSLDILKIGSIKSKNTSLDIYNLKIQLKVNYDSSKKFEKEYRTFAYTIGNLNTQGIQ
ncbi:MAG: hypothetical protein HPY60_10745 [Candidatus Methanofastidiosum sp.]|nr:hypothetical protein [Methanofastidiosum sp.]